jgi:molybdopterin/thiamine biosynthesis adenylyltransferase/proteasome lid subunit RPN8/RPN11
MRNQMSYSLTILEGHYGTLDQSVFSCSGLEGAAYLLCGRSVTANETRMLVREVIPVSNEHYLIRGPNRLSIDSMSYSAVAKRARDTDASIIFVHGHPKGLPNFSEQDDREEPKLLEFLSRRVPGVPHGSLVLTPGKLENGRVWTRDGWTYLDRIRVIGNRFRFFDFQSNQIPLPDFFDRQVRAFGPDIQNLLRRLHIGIVGLGGTGSPTVEQLVRLGVGMISVFDGGAFECSNATRTYGSSLTDDGVNKADLSSAHVTKIGMGTIVNAYARHITDESTARHLRECDIVFSCTDKQAPRGILIQLALRYLIPVFDMGVKIDAPKSVIRGIDGRVTTILPGEACLFCRERITPHGIQLESLSPEERAARANEGYAPQLETAEPAVIAFTTAVASQGVSELLNRLTGFMGPERNSSEVLISFMHSEIRRNRTPPVQGCMCTERELWGCGDEKSFLGLFWSEALARDEVAQ